MSLIATLFTNSCADGAVVPAGGQRVNRCLPLEACESHWEVDPVRVMGALADALYRSWSVQSPTLHKATRSTSMGRSFKSTALNSDVDQLVHLRPDPCPVDAINVERNRGLRAGITEAVDFVKPRVRKANITGRSRSCQHWPRGDLISSSHA